MAAPAAVTAFTTAANAYAAAVQTNAADPSLGQQLAALPDLCAAAISALRSSTAADPEVAAAVSACEVLLAQCAALGDVALAQSPALVSWPVPVPMALAQVAERFYGAQASQHFDEILANNPDVLGLLPLIPAGTVLQLVQVS